MIDIPFKINPYEKAYADLLAHVTKQYPDKRIRFERLDTPKTLPTEFRGYVLIEEKCDTGWREVNRSTEIYAASNPVEGVENSAFAKTMIKVLYFASQSLGFSIDGVKWERENKAAVREEFKPKKSWEDELLAINIDAIRMTDFTGIFEMKKHFRETHPNFPIEALMRDVRTMFNTDKPKMKQVLDMIWGEKKSKAIRFIKNPRKAKRKLTGAALKSAIAGEQKRRDVEANTLKLQGKDLPQMRPMKDVSDLLKKLGMTKQDFAETWPDFNEKYGGLMGFLTNASENELAKVLTNE